MVGFHAFDQAIRFATSDLTAEQISKDMAAFARKELRRLQAAGASKVYSLYVNGRAAAIEDEYRFPGSIDYEFALWEPVLEFALSELQRRSPAASGRFRRSFIIIVDGKVISPGADISATSEVIITNFQPYIRKAEGGQLGTKRFAIFDGTKRALAGRFGNDRRNTPAAFAFETKWLNIGKGIHPEIPYILKGHQRTRMAKQTARSSVHRAGRLTLSRRKDREAGMPITYPAVIMTMVR